MIDVAFTRAGVRQADVAVVVDVLRATSTATQALAAGYRRVLFAETIERARELRGPGRVLAGERHCVKPAGFDQGNSPTEAVDRRGDELILATTNGAPTVVAATQHASRVFLGCLLNLRSVLCALRRLEGSSELVLQIVCSGTNEDVALEDAYFAGRLSAALPGCRTDAALVAEGVARAFESPLRALAQSADARALCDAGLGDDVAFCARESELDVVPVVIAANSSVAALVDAEAIAEALRVVAWADDTVSV